MISFPFESRNKGSIAQPVYDRAITAKNERDMNKACWTNGVFATPTTGLMVIAGDGMQVEVKPGACHIQGARAVEENIRTFKIPTAHSSLDTIHRIVARYDVSESVRSIELYLKEGSPSTAPSAPELVRTEEYYELALADIRVNAAVQSITNAYITDQRFNPKLCGLVVPAIPYEDQTAELWLQIKGSIELVNSALDGTVAGNLSNRITNLETNLHISQNTIDEYKKIGMVV